MNSRRFCTLTAGLSALCVIAASSGRAADRVLTIQAGTMTAGYDTDKGTFFLQKGERRFVPRGSFGDFLPAGPVQAHTLKVEGPLGKGRLIEVEHASGRTVSLELYDGLPLACIRTEIRNGTGRPMTVAQFTPLSARIDLGAAPRICGRWATTDWRRPTGRRPPTWRSPWLSPRRAAALCVAG